MGTQTRLVQSVALLVFTAWLGGCASAPPSKSPAPKKPQSIGEPTEMYANAGAKANAKGVTHGKYW